MILYPDAHFQSVKEIKLDFLKISRKSIKYIDKVKI